MERVSLKDGVFTITDDDYADRAQEIMKRNTKVIKEGDKQKEVCFPGLTTTKLRGIYAQVVNVNSKITNKDEFKNSSSDLQYLKVKMAYEAGRYDKVKKFLDETHLLAFLDDLKTYDQFQLYCRYAESLVAYFKYFGGKE